MSLTGNINNKNKEIRLIWGLSIASIVIYINLYLVQGILPLITETFDVDISHSTLLLSVTSFAMACSLLFYALLSDRIGRKTPLMISLYMLLLTDVLMIFVTDFSSLVVLRLLQGFLLAAVPAIAMAYFKDELSQASMLKAGGIYIAANSIGGISGRLIGGALSLHLHWQQVMFVILIISIIGVLLVHYLLPITNKLKKSDEIKGRQRIFMAEDLNGFMVHLRDTKLRKIYLVGGLAFLIMVNQFSFVQLHLMSTPFSWGRFEVTLIFLCYLSGTWASYYSGHWIKRFGRRTLFRLSLLLMFFGTLITLINTGVFICFGFLMTAFGFFFIHSGCNAWVTHRAKCHRAKATSLYLCSYYLGAALGGPLLMPFWHHWGWEGVVLGSSLIMAVLGLTLLRLTKDEPMILSAHASNS
ncbi:MAG: MFS transporter [Shewanella sp.]